MYLITLWWELETEKLLGQLEMLSLDYEFDLLKLAKYFILDNFIGINFFYCTYEKFSVKEIKKWMGSNGDNIQGFSMKTSKSEKECEKQWKTCVQNQLIKKHFQRWITYKESSLFNRVFLDFQIKIFRHVF